MPRDDREPLERRWRPDWGSVMVPKGTLSDVVECGNCGSRFGTWPGIVRRVRCSCGWEYERDA